MQIWLLRIYTYESFRHFIALAEYLNSSHNEIRRSCHLFPLIIFTLVPTVLCIIGFLSECLALNAYTFPHDHLQGIPKPFTILLLILTVITQHRDLKYFRNGLFNYAFCKRWAVSARNIRLCSPIRMVS